LDQLRIDQLRIVADELQTSHERMINILYEERKRIRWNGTHFIPSALSLVEIDVSNVRKHFEGDVMKQIYIKRIKPFLSTEVFIQPDFSLINFDKNQVNSECK